MAITPITIVGCGPGSPDYLTPAAHKAIQDADVLAGAKRLLKQHAPHGVPRIVVQADIPGVLDQIEGYLARHRRVTVLVTGDPGLFSLAQPVLKRFGQARCRVIPGVSSVQVAFARLGLDWTDARILSAHDRTPVLKPSDLTRFAKIAILAGGNRTQKWIRAFISRTPREYRIFLCEDLTLRNERVREISRKDFARLPISARAIILLVKDSELTIPNS